MTQNRKQLILFLLITLLLLGTLLAGLLVFNVTDPSILISSILGATLAILGIGWFLSQNLNTTPISPLELPVLIAPANKLENKLLLTPEQEAEKQAKEQQEEKEKDQADAQAKQLIIDELYRQHDHTRDNPGIEIPIFKECFEMILEEIPRERDITPDYTPRADYYRLIEGEDVRMSAETLPYKLEIAPEGRGLKNIQVIKTAFQKINEPRWADFLYNRINQNFFVTAAQLQFHLLDKRDFYINVDKYHLLEFTVRPQEPQLCKVVHCFAIECKDSRKILDIGIRIHLTLHLDENNICKVRDNKIDILYLNGKTQESSIKDPIIDFIRAWIPQDLERQVQAYVQDQRERAVAKNERPI